MKKSYFVLSALTLLLFLPKITLADPLFRRPLNSGSLTPVIRWYYDHQANSGLQKYSCASPTDVYNGHQGNDFRANTGTNVYAAAQGGLYHRYNECDTNGYLGSDCGGGYGNHVRIDHEGNMTDGVGWRTIYAHLKRNTAVWPMSVLCSAYVGQSGSSGNSSAPHLHFEVKKYSGLNNDPFSGSCSSHLSTWWTSQSGSGVPGTQCQ